MATTGRWSGFVGRRGLLAVVVVVANLAAVVGLSASGRADPISTGRSALSTHSIPSAKRLLAPTPSGRTHKLVFRNGDLVAGVGEVQVVPGKPTRFCDPNQAYAADSGQPPSCIGVNAYGVDNALLSHRFTQGNVTYGQAELVGVFDHGNLRVRDQRPASAYPDEEPRVPCSPPAGGWARAKPSPPGIVTPWVNLAAMGRYTHAHAASTLRIASLAASNTQAVAVIVTTADPRRVRAALASSYPRALCVVGSRYTRSEITRTAARLKILTENQTSASLTEVEALGFGYDFAPDGQMCTVMTMPTMTRRVAKIVDAQPAGIVQVTTFLRRA